MTKTYVAPARITSSSTVIEARIRHYIEARSFAKPELYYHGTSDKMLRGILKNGLVPEPPQRLFAARDMTKDFGASIATIGGIYLTRSAQRAHGYASDAVRKFGGKYRLIVACMIQERAALPDEDQIMFLTSLYFSKGIVEAENNTWLMIQYYVPLYLNNKVGQESLDYNYGRIVRQLDYGHPDFEQSLAKRHDVGKLREIVRRMMLTEIRRRLSFSRDNGHDKWRSIDYDIDHVLSAYDPFDTRDEVKLKQKRQEYAWLYNIPDRNTCERERREIIDQISRVIKSVAVPKPTADGDDFKMRHHTLRVDHRIGFSGRSRIISIFTEEEHQTENKYRPNYVIRSHYGRVPQAYVDAFFQFQTDRRESLKIVDWVTGTTSSQREATA